MKRFKQLLFLFLSFGFRQFLFCQDSTEYYLTRNSWCAVKGDIYSDTIQLENLPDSIISKNLFGYPVFNHDIFTFDSAKKELGLFRITIDSVGAAAWCKWDLSDNKKILMVGPFYEDAPGNSMTSYSIAILNDKQMLLIRKK